MREEEMKRDLEDKLYLGKTVRIEYWSMNKDGTYKFKTSKIGVVFALYPHIFMVRVGNFLESFRYSQCFERSYERVRI